jgi:hypothetical protein
MIEGVARINTLVLSSIGYEAGEDLEPLNYGGDYDQSTWINEWLPDNMRLMLNLSAAVTVDADPNPYDGQRLAVVDVAGNLATYNFTIDGNGRKIEGAATLTLSTNSDARQWMYRADTGNWVRINTLAEGDQMPFPTEFDTYFVTALALRLNPMYGQALPPETGMALKRSLSKLRARYRHRNPHATMDAGLLSPEERVFSDDDFNSGRYGPWT